METDPRGWIAQAQARCDAATEGPWFRRANDLIGGECVMPVDAPPSSGVPEVADFVLPADAEFIAHARTDLPRALAALTAVLDRADQWDEEFPEARTQFAEAVRQCLTNIRGTVAAALAGEA